MVFEYSLSQRKKKGQPSWIGEAIRIQEDILLPSVRQ